MLHRTDTTRVKERDLAKQRPLRDKELGDTSENKDGALPDEIDLEKRRENLLLTMEFKASSVSRQPEVIFLSELRIRSPEGDPLACSGWETTECGASGTRTRQDPPLAMVPTKGGTCASPDSDRDARERDAREEGKGAAAYWVHLGDSCPIESYHVVHADLDAAGEGIGESFLLIMLWRDADFPNDSIAWLSEKVLAVTLPLRRRKRDKYLNQVTLGSLSLACAPAPSKLINRCTAEAVGVSPKTTATVH